MLKRRKTIEKLNQQWMVPDETCWLFNDSILPSSRVFLPCRIKTVRPSEPEYAKVLLDDQRYFMELKVKRRFLFRRTPFAEGQKVPTPKLMESLFPEIEEEEFGEVDMDQFGSLFRSEDRNHIIKEKEELVGKRYTLNTRHQHYPF